MRHRLQSACLFACGIALAAPGAIPLAHGVEARRTGFMLTSTTFKEGGMLPVRVSFRDADNCNGENLSPQFSWAKPPAGTKSFFLTEITEEGSNGLGEVNLVAYGIPVGVSSLAEGELSKPSPNYVGGKNRLGGATWRGMCPPPGTSVHHYIFKIVATDMDPKALPPGLTLPELQAKMAGHAIDSTVMVGLYRKP